MPTLYETSEAIVAGIGQGDRLAEQALVEKYARALIYVLERRTGDRERAKDIQQEAFLIVLQKLRKEPLQDPTKLNAYIQKTAINLFIGEIRKETRRNTTFDSELLDMTAVSEGDQYLALVRERAKVVVKKIIAELQNERDRQILTLYYIEDGAKELVCERLDLSHRHFDRVISRARARFKLIVESKKEDISLEVVS